MRDALYSAIHDKVTAHIDAHKKDIAQNLIAPESRLALQDEPDSVEVSDETEVSIEEPIENA